MRSLPARGVVASITLALLIPGAAVLAGDAWPSWRGPRHDGSAATSAALSLTPSSALAIEWKRPLGSGYSGISIADGRVFTMFADGDVDWVGAFDAASGKPLWRYRVDSRYVGHDGSHDGPLSTPAVAGDRVVALGARGQLVCLDARTGKRRWAVDLTADHGVVKPTYGFAGSPVVHDGLVIVGTGTGETPTLSAFELGSGELRWQTAGRDRLPNQTPILVSGARGVELIAAGRDRVSAWDPSSGLLIWQLEHGGRGADVSVVPTGEGRMSFNTGWSETMSVSLRWPPSGEIQAPDRQGMPLLKESWRTAAFGRSFSTPVHHRGHLFGYTGAFLSCIDATTGERRWKSREPGDGFLILVDDHLVTLTRTGELHLGRASPEGYRSSTSLKVLDTASWTAPSFSRDMIFVRSFDQLAAVRITSGERAPAARPAAAGRIAGSLTARLADQVETAEDKSAVIARFLERHDRSPIVEGDDLAHIVYRGPAGEVDLMADVFFGAPDYLVRERRPLHRVPGTDFFFYTLRLEAEARVNYQLSVDLADPIPDPLNPTVVEVERLGDMSVLAMPRWQPAAAFTAASVEPGRIDKLTVHSGLLDRDLTLEVYLPPGYDGSGHRYPTLYLSDAEHALGRGALDVALDARSAAGEPVIAVMIAGTGWGEHVGRRRGAYVEALAKEIVPLIDDRYRTLRGPDDRAAVGCGQGGIVSLLAALAHPGVFSRVGSLSAYALPDLSAEIQDLARASDSLGLAIYLEWGRYDLRTGEGNLDIPAENRKLATALSASGFTVATREVPEGFGWATWKHRIGRMLEWLVTSPPPRPPSPVR